MQILKMSLIFAEILNCMFGCIYRRVSLLASPPPLHLLTQGVFHLAYKSVFTAL